MPKMEKQETKPVREEALLRWDSLEGRVQERMSAETPLFYTPGTDSLACRVALPSPSAALAARLQR